MRGYCLHKQFPPVLTWYTGGKESITLRGDFVVRKPCSILLLCVLLGFCVSVIIPAQDLVQTAYDESEGLSYESAPMFSAGVGSTRQIVSRLHSLFATRVAEASANQIPPPKSVSLLILHHLLRR